MIITLTRYFGNNSVTKSILQTEFQGQTFTCEARESAYRDYSEPFVGSSNFCLPSGTLLGRLKSSDFSPMTLHIGRTCNTCRTPVAFDLYLQSRKCKVLIGRADSSVPPEARELSEQKETFDSFTRIMYRAFADGERIVVNVINKITPQL